MTVRVTREAEPQFDLFGAYEGEVLGGAENTLAHLTFTASGDYLIVVPKNDLSQPQVEVGDTPSSYIPTSGSTVTRAGETLTAPSANLPWSSSAVSIAMEGEMTYADTDPAGGVEVFLVRWRFDGTNYIRLYNNTGGANTGRPLFLQRESGTQDFVGGAVDYWSPGVNVPFSIASRHGSTFVNGAVDGSALTADTTPTALPDLSSTDLEIGSDFMGTIKSLRIWADDIGDDGIEEASS